MRPPRSAGAPSEVLPSGRRTGGSILAALAVGVAEVLVVVVVVVVVVAAVVEVAAVVVVVVINVVLPAEDLCVWPRRGPRLPQYSCWERWKGERRSFVRVCGWRPLAAVWSIGV